MNKSKVRVASAQFEVSAYAHFDEFESQVRGFVEQAAAQGADFLVFPEFFTVPLLSTAGEQLHFPASMAYLDGLTARFEALFAQLALAHKINIFAGTHPCFDEGGVLRNYAFVFLRDGRKFRQAKIHATPNEKSVWGIEGGNALEAIETDCGKVGVLVCYDSEFPEVVRCLTDLGALILFVPYCTDDRAGHLRVRYCCQARAVENQIYVVAAGLVGEVSGIENTDVHYAISGVFTPCDTPFPADGLAAQAQPNVEDLIVTDLDLDVLQNARAHGTVQNLNDRRVDFYGRGYNFN